MIGEVCIGRECRHCRVGTVIVMSGMMFDWSKDLLFMIYEELYLL